MVTRFNIPPSLATYNGGKGSAGTYQRLINEIPPHTLYLEMMLGGGKVLHYKKPAPLTMAMDIDPQVIREWVKANPSAPYMTFRVGNSLQKIAEMIGSARYDDPEVFMYLDPPYLMHRRLDDRSIYKNEMPAEEHYDLLELIVQFEQMKIMITCYDDPLYEIKLVDWHKWQFQSMTRNGLATQTVYQNYPLGGPLHDYRYLGDDFRDRERITRKVKRWAKKLRGLPEREQAAIMERLTMADTVRNGDHDPIATPSDNSSWPQKVRNIFGIPGPFENDFII